MSIFRFAYGTKRQKEKRKLDVLFSFFVLVYIHNEKRKNGSFTSVFRFPFYLTYKTTKGKTEVNVRFLVFRFGLHVKRQKKKRKFDFRFPFFVLAYNNTTKEKTEI